MISSFSKWSAISFANPWMLLFALLIPIVFLLKYWFRKKRIEVYTLSYIPKAVLLNRVPLIVRLRPLLDCLLGLAMLAMIVGLARPQLVDAQKNEEANGIDIVISLDVSESMMAEDFKPNRLEAAKLLSEKFIASRRGDRIGLVIFSGESFTQCPITLDHRVIVEQLKKLQKGVLRSGTSIGNGLATAVDRLRDGKGKSKVVVMLTDGEDSKLGGNTIDPETAINLATTYGVKVYTIGVGRMGQAPMVVTLPDGTRQRQIVEVKIDEPLLKKIAKTTNGKYYRATSNKSLALIYKEIDKLEKNAVKVTAFTSYDDIFHHFLYIALALLALYSLLRFTVFRSITE